MLAPAALALWSLLLPVALARQPAALQSASSASKPLAPSGERSAPDPEIQRAELEAAVTWLAADERRGRATGTPEAAEAGRWLAAELAAAGVEPAGDDGFLQNVPFGQCEFTAHPELVLEREGAEPRALVWGVDFDSVSAPVEELVLELAVVRSEGEPPKASATHALFVDAPDRRAARRLARSLAAGWGLVVERGSAQAGQPSSELPKPLRVMSGPPKVTVRGPIVDELAAAAGARLRLKAPGKVTEQPAFNVVGLLRGKGTAERPELAGQAVVLSAHYDHLPPARRAPEGADVIHNGADDDASGCAAVLELAEALAAGPPPARTVVFLLATGEEIGLVGTHFYLDHPVVPLECTVANVNFEMIGRPDALAGGAGKLWLTGYERSNLGPAFAAAGLTVVADPRPDQNFFQRSDNFAFAVRGIVAQTLSSYDLHEDYHSVRDEASRLDYAHMEGALRSALTGVRALVDGEIDPAWEPGGNPQR
jgi:hypothetical protein